jgi:hypothetical protein
MRVSAANRVLVKLGGSGLAAALEDARSTFQQVILPLMDHRRVDAMGRGQFRYSALALQGLQRNTRLECRVVVPAFRHVCSPVC